MDVKKPGPFFEASPNNFYLDKLTYRYETDSNNDEAMTTVEGNNKTKIEIDNGDAARADADATEQGKGGYLRSSQAFC